MAGTIKDVAKLAGVSIATVSHVINKTRYVSPDLVKHVEEAIEQTGYRISRKSLNIQQSKMPSIAFLVPDISSNVFSEMTRTIEEYLNDKGYALIVLSCNESIEREQKYIKFT